MQPLTFAWFDTPATWFTLTWLGLGSGQWTPLPSPRQRPYLGGRVDQPPSTRGPVAARPNEDPKNLHTTGGRAPDLTWEVFQRVCAALALHGGKYKACEANHVGYTTVMRAIKEAGERGDDEWQELWDTSYEQFRESLEQAAITRHVDGVEQNRYDKDGKLISTEIVYSDRMGELLLKGHFPERFRDKIFVSGSVGLEPVDAFANLSAKAKREIRAIIMRDLEEQRELARAATDADIIDVTPTAAAALEDMRAAPPEEDEA
jgi:hypothetical protein